METNVLAWLERQEQMRPAATAFADEKTALTFAQLGAGARAAGSFFAQRSAQRAPIAFLTEKSAALVAGFLGAAYAGGFYALIDAKHPVPRMQAILEVLQPALLVTDAEHLPLAQSLGFAGEVVLLSDACAAPVNAALLGARRAAACDTDPLYAIFTSGSTGVPKGVLVSHRSVLDFISIFVQTFGITASDVLGNQAPFDFDVSVKDIYTGLCTGACVQIIPRAYFSFPTKLMDFLCEREVTVLVWAVSALCFVTTMKGLDYKVPHTLRQIMFSGEVMPVKHLNQWRAALPQARYVNLYGPTEITCNCTYHIIERAYTEEEKLPIGRPFVNEGVFLLDEADHLVPQTDTETLGELCVRGTALALGYYNDPARTVQVFVQNPLHSHYPETIYRTGDLARYLADGTLLYVSRKDFQIKHMGHRIELGEVTAATEKIVGVNRACTLYWAEKARILLFYDGVAEKREVQKTLRAVLPAFMQPNAVTPLGQLPLTKNGKIDRAALLADYLAAKEK